MAPLRIGVLGAARIAPLALVKPARRIDGVEVAGVAARDPARAQAFAAKHGIAKTYGSYQALLEDPDIDAVYNPLPNGLHGHWTLAAIAAGKHVLCEKPFTANAVEAEQVAAVAAQSGLVVMEAFHYRHHPLAARLHEIVGEGELGAPRRIEIRFSAPLALRGDIRYQLDLAGGATMDMGCYVVNLLRLLAGGEPTVTGARAKLSSPGVDRAMQADVSLPGGGTGRVRCSMFSSSLLRMHAVLEAEKGSLRVFNPFAPHYLHRLSVRAPSGNRIERFSKRPTYDFQLEHFVAAVNDGGPVLTTPEDAIKNMAVIDRVYEAAGLEPRHPTG
jgi:predicted dehydrogenase